MESALRIVALVCNRGDHHREPNVGSPTLGLQRSIYFNPLKVINNS